MASNPLIISWNNFTGWVNDQKFQWQAWRYYLGYWVDTQRYDVVPTNTPDILNTYDWGITAIFNRTAIDWNDNNVVWAWSKIYYDTTLRHTLTQWTQGYNIWYMKPIWASDIKLYYFHYTTPDQTKYIHRSEKNWTTFEQSYKSYTSTAWNPFFAPPAWMIVISEWERILFSYYNTIWEISNSEVVTKLLDLPEIENVVWITEFQWQYKIYTSVADSTSKMYTWDWWSDIPETSVVLAWLWITSVQNYGAYDYVIADSNLYLFAWVQYQELYRWIGGKFYWSSSDMVYLGLLQWTKYTLCELWTKPWYNKALTPKYIVDVENQSNDISAFTYNNNWPVFASYTKLYRVSWTPEIWAVIPFIESLVFVWDSIAFLKELNEIRVKFSWFTTQNIIVYCQIQESWTWIKLFEWNNTTISSINHWLKISKNKFLNPIWNFNTIRFRVEFPHTWTAQWRFYWIDVFGNQDIWV